MNWNLYTACLTVTLLDALMLPAANLDLKDVANKFGPPALWVTKPKPPPVIDGNLDDQCWKEVKPVTLGFTSGSWWESPSQKTEAQVQADDTAIYFAVRCFEAEPDRIVPGGKPRDGMIVGADTIEFFMDPGNHRQLDKCYHVIVSATGTVYQDRGLGGE